jgi:hypothetical protein
MGLLPRGVVLLWSAKVILPYFESSMQEYSSTAWIAKILLSKLVGFCFVLYPDDLFLCFRISQVCNFCTCARDGFGLTGRTLARGLRPPRAGSAGAFVRLGSAGRRAAAAAALGRGRFQRRRGRRGALAGHGPRPADALPQQIAHAMAEHQRPS